MPYRDIDASLSPADAKKIKDSFAAIQALLPFLITLSVKERRATFKAGPDSVSFIQNALTAAEEHPEILPATFDTKAFKRDLDLFTVLTDIGTIAASIASEIDDTRLAAGGEAMQEGTLVYNYVKTAAKTTPGLKPVAEQLAERFRRAKRKKQPEPAAE